MSLASRISILDAQLEARVKDNRSLQYVPFAGCDRFNRSLSTGSQCSFVSTHPIMPTMVSLDMSARYKVPRPPGLHLGSHHCLP